MTATATNVSKERASVIRLATQKQRATFVRREIRSQGANVNSLAEEAELSWITVHNFAQEVTRFPRMETVVKIFRALGYDVVFTARRGSRGTIAVI